jgi:ABC-type phosphate/phosphonate transport system ATPase subunit
MLLNKLIRVLLGESGAGISTGLRLVDSKTCERVRGWSLIEDMARLEVVSPPLESRGCLRGVVPRTSLNLISVDVC